VLAESERGLPGKVPVRFDQLAASVLDAHAELAAKRGVSLRRVLADRLVPGDPLLLERLISNLVTNAIMFNQPDGWVEVTVSAQPALTVRNTGQDIPAAAALAQIAHGAIAASLYSHTRAASSDVTSLLGSASRQLS
jgi:signal transduction histidine kinase